jgi:hypothetical protein
MAPQPGIIEAILAQLGNMTSPVETAVLPAYGTDREVYLYLIGPITKRIKLVKCALNSCF